MTSRPRYSSDELVSELRECATVLVDKLSSDHYDEAMEVIDRLVAARDQSLYTAVGRLTRGLHEAIKNLNVEADLSSDPTRIDGSDMSDASDRLSYVITMTQAAADNTLEKAETTVDKATAVREQARRLQAEWDAAGADTPVEGLETDTRAFLEQTDACVDDVRRLMQEVILEQGFQDLTGQVLGRVMDLIKGVERDLVELVKIAGQVEELTGLVEEARDQHLKGERSATAATGPTVNPAGRSDVVSGQDEVDDLLSSLGF